MPLVLGRPISVVIEGMGRNSVWYLFPILLLIMAGSWMSLQISKRCGDVPLMAACGKVAFRWLTPVAYFLYATLYLGTAAYMIALSGSFSSQTLQYGESRTAMVFETFIAVGAALFPMETMIRFAQILAVLVVPIIVALTLTMLMNAQWHWLLPIFNTAEMAHPVPAAAAILCIFSPLATVALINRKNTNVSIGSLSICLTIAALFLSYLTAMGIATFGIHSARRMEYLFFYTQSAVHIENFIFERIIFIGSLLLVFFKVVGNGFMMRSSAFCLARMFGRRLGIFPILMAGGGIAAVLWNIDMPFFFRHFPVWLGCYSFFLIAVWPALLYSMLLMRGKRA